MIDLDSIQRRLARVWGKWPTAGVAAPNADDHGPKAWAAHGPVRFHATEQGRARQWVQAQADAAFVTHAPSDIAALLAEVERLRGEADRERAAVVASLRQEAEAAAHTLQAEEWAKRIDDIADCIERGEHRSEGDK